MSVPADQIATVTVSATAQRVRAPRALVKLGGFGAGDIVPGWISWSVSSNTFYEADSFRIEFATSALPSSNDANWFSTQRELFAEIFAGFPSDPQNPQLSELQSLIYGRVDEIEYDPAQRLITLTGRDLTAVFIDNKIASQYTNQTSSDIALTLAALHNLNATVAPTQTKVGTYYEQDQVQLQANRSEWDLLAYLARREGFVVYVQGTTLFFQPDPTNTNEPYEIGWIAPDVATQAPISDALEIKFSRALTVAKGVAVTARSANFDAGRPIVQSYPSSAKTIQAGKASPFGEVQNYFFTMAPGHSALEVEAFAKAQYDAIVAHEMKLSARLIADNVLTTQIPIRIRGTGTAFDQIYYARKIEREMSLDEGYVMSVEAQNVNPDSSPQS
ncbi:MAG TPA: hypothetical protein VFB37_00895 [Steroidobacteraceae bacterium]|nr:hypothetical protein [Steroidobacteraceae bacterium]